MNEAPQPKLDAPTLDVEPAPPGPPAAEAPTLSPVPSPAEEPTVARAEQAPPGYEILGELGRGGMGVVYKARQLRLNRLVALKMILAGAHAGPLELGRLRAEAEAVARLQHPHIVQIYEVGEQDGRPYLALEYIDGGSLADRLDATPQPPRLAAQLIQALAGAVEAAHQQDIVHRDLKPANILLQKSQVRNPKTEVADSEVVSDFGFRISDYTPKVTDFGLAKRLGDSAGPTQSGAILGTPSYMSPEQASGQGKSVGPATDIYALGAILYELLTGRPPFKAATPLETVLQVTSEEPVLPTRLQPKLPRDLETICLKCLQKDPRRRYASAADLAEDLQRFLANEPIRARPVRWWERAVKWARRRPAAAALLGVSLAALVALLTVGALYQARLERSLAAVTRAKEKADWEHKRAQDHLHKALAAVDEIAKLGIDGLADDPQFADLRRRLAEEALTLHRGFLEKESDEPMVRRGTARAYAQTAGLYLFLGKAAEAEPACQEAIKLQEQLVADFPDQNEYQYDLSTSYSFLGHSYSIQGLTDRATAAYEKARDLAEHIVKREPHNAEYQANLATFYLWLGYPLMFTAPARAEERFREVIRIGEQLTQAHPEVARYRWLLAGGYSSVGSARFLAGRQGDAEKRQAEAEQLLKQALAILLPDGTELTGESREYYEFLNQARVDLGKVYLRTNRIGQARESLAQGIAGYERLRKRNPKHFSYRIFLMFAYQCQGELYDHTKEPAPAVEAWRKTTEIADQLMADHPKLFWLGLFAGQYQVGYQLALIRHGDVDRALALTEDFAKQKNLAPVAEYNLACIYAVAAGAVEGNRPRSEALAQQAMEWLKKAEQAGFFRQPARVKDAQKDEDLNALRPRADFQELMRRVEKPLP